MHALNVRDNYHRLSDVVLGRNDASHQPFILGFTVGAEYDLSKIREVSGSLLFYLYCKAAIRFWLLKIHFFHSAI